MKLIVKKGTTSKLIQVFIQDSSLTTGAGLTGLVFNTASLTAYYYREGAASVTAITLATMTLGTWATGGFIVADGTNMPGVYQLGIPDAAIASGANSVVVMLKGATNMAPVVLEIELVAFDEQDAVRLGLTAIPNATAGATNGLPLAVDNSGRVDVLKINGTSQTGRDLGASVLLSAGTGTGQLDFTSGVVKSNLVQILATALTETAGLLAAGFKQFFNVVAPTGNLNSLPSTAAGANGGLPLSVDASGRVDVLKINGTSQTARDIGASVLLSSGSGTGQLDFTSGVVKANLAQILGTALTETAGLLAGGFKKFFNVATPTGTVNSIPDVVPGAAGGLFIAGANAATSITTALTANIIGNITGNLSGSVGSVTAGVTLAAAAIQAVWDALTANLTTANSIGKRLADDIDATVSSRLATSGYTAPDNATITTINSRIGAPVGASISADVASVKADTSVIQTTAQSALTAQGYTTTRAGYLDTLNGLVAAIWATVVSDLSAVPTSTATIQSAISWVYMVARNLRTQTATTETIYKNDGVTALATSAKTDNGTTFTRGKYA